MKKLILGILMIAAMEWQAKAVQNGQFLYCPNGSHLSMWDDQAVFMGGIVKFIRGTAE